MKVSVKSDYALRAALELAVHYKKKTLGAGEIARNQVIPKRFLEQLLLSLKKAGIVNSFRGKEGGYSLKKAPAEITAADVVRAVEGDINLLPKRRRKKTKDVILDIWTQMQGSVTGILQNITLDVLVEKKKKAEKVLTYTI